MIACKLFALGCMHCRPFVRDHDCWRVGGSMPIGNAEGMMELR
jgi:hypothetical protein